MKVLLVGTGYMAKEYAKVLEELRIDYDVVGRGLKNCSFFKSQFPNVNVHSGGLENFRIDQKYTHSIITSNIEFLSSHSKLLIDIGIKDLLLEKPGSLNFDDLNDLVGYVKRNNARVIVAYNRRFYSSVLKCRTLIENDGGVNSFNFEFTEWPNSFENIPNYEIVKQNLFFANSTHIIDMAFYIGGMPSEIKSFSLDKLDWHEKAIFSGAGMTNKNVLFSYNANWKGPGRWGCEFITSKNRYIFRPLEVLQVQKLNQLSIEFVELDNKLDLDFKPGLYMQLKTYLFDFNNPNLLLIEEHLDNCEKIYKPILEGN